MPLDSSSLHPKTFVEPITWRVRFKLSVSPNQGCDHVSCNWPACERNKASTTSICFQDLQKSYKLDQKDNTVIFSITFLLAEGIPGSSLIIRKMKLTKENKQSGKFALGTILSLQQSQEVRL